MFVGISIKPMDPLGYGSASSSLSYFWCLVVVLDTFLVTENFFGRWWLESVKSYVSLVYHGRREDYPWRFPVGFVTSFQMILRVVSGKF